MKKRLISMLMALLFIASLGTSAFADNWDIANGNISVDAISSGQTVSQGEIQNYSDPAPVITGTSNTYTVTINADDGATANVTLQDVNIDMSGSGDAQGDVEGKAAVSVTGSGNVNIELNGDNNAQGGYYHAGIEKSGDGTLTLNDTDKDATLNATGGDYAAGIGGGVAGTGKNITINDGDITATGGKGAAGMGGGYAGDSYNLTINDGSVNAQGGDGGSGIGSGDFGDSKGTSINGGNVQAKGGNFAAAIGAGADGTCSDVTISGDAQVKAQEGANGTAIGNGAVLGYGKETKAAEPVAPDTSKLSPNGSVSCYDSKADMSKDEPTTETAGTYIPPVETVEMPSVSSPLYAVTDKDGKSAEYKYELKDGVLTITADADFAILTGRLSAINTLKAQGVETIVFVTNNTTSTFALADLSAKGSSGSYVLTHDGTTVTFVLGDADISDILK